MVRLYQSPAQGKRRFIENDSDISAGRSPVCGAAVLGRILPHKSSSSSTGLADKRGPATDFVSVHHHAKKGLFQPGLSYESIDGSPTYSGGRKSPESTESSTSASSHSEDDPDDPCSESYALQFEPRQQVPEHKTQQQKEPLPVEETSSDRQKLRMNRLQSWVAQQQDETEVASKSNSQPSPAATPSAGFIIRNKANIWSTNLPVVTEETSFEMEDSSQASGGAGTNAKEGSHRAEGGQPLKNVRSYSSPEKNEMLLAMRQLVLKQQSALTEMAEENRTHRRELQECRQLLQVAKQTYTRQQRRLEAFTVEKDSADAEVLWLREEVKTLRTEIQKQQQEAKKPTWTADKVAEEVEDAPRQVRSETPEAKREQFQTPPRRHEPLFTEATPAPSPVTSPAQTWRFKNILPEVKDSASESDDELVKEFRSLRQTLKGAGISTEAAELQLLERQRKARIMPDVRESRDEQPSGPSNVGQQHHTRVESPGMPDDELRDWNRSRSPLRPATKRPTTQPPEQATTGHVRQSPFRKLDSSSWRQREAPRALSEVSAGSCSSISAASSMVSQRSREEVALFKNRLEAIQKKREHRKQIEETVGSRSGRVRFT